MINLIIASVANHWIIMGTIYTVLPSSPASVLRIKPRVPHMLHP